MANVAAYEQPGRAITLVPATSFEAKRYTFGTINSSGDLVTPAAGAKACGVVQTPGIIGEPCNVMVSGVSFIVLGGTVAKGAEVESDVNGKAITLASGKSNGICLFGGTAGQIGCILLK